MSFRIEYFNGEEWLLMVGHGCSTLAEASEYCSDLNSGQKTIEFRVVTL